MISRLLASIVITQVRGAQASLHSGVRVLGDVFHLTAGSDEERILYRSEEDISGETFSYDGDNRARLPGIPQTGLTCSTVILLGGPGIEIITRWS